MWDSPYQASRFCTDSTAEAEVDADLVAAASAIASSGMTRPQIGFLDPLVLGQVGIMAFRQHLTACQDGDDVGEIGYHAEIMFYHQDGVLYGATLVQRSDLLDVFMFAAGHRLVEQHHLRVERQGGRDLERAFAPIGHLDRRRPGELA